MESRYVITTSVESQPLIEQNRLDYGYYSEEYIRNHTDHDLIITNCRGEQLVLTAAKKNIASKFTVTRNDAPYGGSNGKQEVTTFMEPYDVTSKEIVISYKGFIKESINVPIDSFIPKTNTESTVYTIRITQEDLYYGNPIFIPEMDIMLSMPNHGPVVHPIQRVTKIFHNVKEQNIKEFNLENNINISMCVNISNPKFKDIQHIFVNVLNSTFIVDVNHEIGNNELMIMSMSDNVLIKTIPLDDLLKNGSDVHTIGNVNVSDIFIGTTKANLNNVIDKVVKNSNVYSKLYVDKLNQVHDDNVKEIHHEYKIENSRTSFLTKQNELELKNKITNLENTFKQKEYDLNNDFKHKERLLKEKELAAAEEFKHKERMFREKEQSFKDDVKNMKNKKWKDDILSKSIQSIITVVIEICKILIMPLFVTA